MDNLGFALDGAWRVLLAGLLLGAGVPAVFALGIREMSHGARARDTAARHHATAARLAGVLCFALVVAAVGLGITFIVASGFGKVLNFDHVYPTLSDKP